jgi:peroxiredoxin Q/BCP
MALSEGDHLPDVELETDGGGTLSAAALAGRKTVVYFYPKDDTSGCTKEALAFRDALADFTEAGVTLLGVSPDGVASHDRFKAKHALNFSLVSDPDHELAGAFGVWVEKNMYGRKYMGIERSTFLFDANGVLRRIWRKVKVPGHAAAVLEAARALD